MSPRPPLRLPVDGPGEQGTVTLRFLGAARTTTGSLHRVRAPQGDVVLDCGMYQGHRAEAEQWNRELPLDPGRVKLVVVSHAHIDHCGALPNLVRMGYRGPILATEATCALLPILLRDSAKIQAIDLERVNRGLPPHERKQPLYTDDDVEATLRLLRGTKYGRDAEPVPGLVVRFADAGHILGSAAVHLTVRPRGGRDVRIGFTGDLGRTGVPLLRDPEPLGECDAFLTESTYGDREHDDESGMEERLAEVVSRTAARGGKVIVPAFAVGRTQLLLYVLHRLIHDRRIPNVPIYVDSPMARAVTQVFRDHEHLFDGEARQFVSCCGELFDAARTSFVEDKHESRALNGLEGPAVVISASGMLEGGRIVHHVIHHGADPRNTLLFVGYQAEHTLGRRLLDGERIYRAFGEQHELRCEVAEIPGLSAHADRRGIAAYLEALPERPARTFLVHGEAEKMDSLKGYLASRGHTGLAAPAPGEWFRIGD